ncbi:MAG: glycosyltransferase family 2 protein, partial [Clostridium celatum]|nr:glycosyltransferase family 2 protein [Clostridium celatum]
MKILVIIPAYNEEKSIVNVVKNIKDSCPNVDYVIINDCSKDNTKKIIEENKLNYISLPVNMGIGGGVQTGYKYAVENNYDIAIQIDGDGQHDPSYIDKIIKPIID